MLEKYLKSQSLGRGFVSGRGRAHASIRSRALNSNFMEREHLQSSTGDRCTKGLGLAVSLL